MLHYVSYDGEGSYPGTLEVTAVYTLTDDDALRLDYTASTDKNTVVNLDSIILFQSARPGGGDILRRQVQINADRFTLVDSTLIPTGALAVVADTPFDLRAPRAIGAHIKSNDNQLRFGHRYATTGSFRAPARRVRSRINRAFRA